MIATRPLGRAGLDVTELGFGTAALGNLYAPVSDDAARDTLVAAMAAGVGFVDTAPYYGFGLSERRVGDVVRGHDIVISTKVGRILDPVPGATGLRHGFATPMPFAPRFDYTRDGVLRSHEASLQRLGIARINVLLVHDIGQLTHGADADRHMAELVDGGGLDALLALREEGRVDAIGLGVNEIEPCLELLPRFAMDVILLAGRYTLLEQGALDTLFPAAAAAGTSVVIGGPYNSGILADRRQGCYDYHRAPPAIVARVEALSAACLRHGTPLAAAALAFVLAHPQVASVIPGARTAGEVADTLAWHAASVPAALWRDLIDQGLIDRAAPVPL